MVEHLLCSAVFDNLAVIHHRHVVGYLCNDTEVVGDEDDAHVVFLLKGVEEVEDGLLYGDIEGGGGLVGNEKVGVAYQCYGYHDALLLSTADFMRIAAIYLLGSG